MNVFFFDEYNSSLQNGIGTYRDILLPAIGSADDVDLTLVSLNSDKGELTATERSFGKEIALPYVFNGDWRGNGKEICDMLSGHIADSDQNVFMLNHSPCADFIKALKKCFPKTKIVFTVHDQGWCSALLGSRKLLEEIILENRRPASVSENTYNNILAYHKSEIDIYELVDKVVSISPFMDGVMKDIYKVPDSKRAMIYNGYTRFSDRKIRQNTARKILGIGEDEEIVVFAGRPVRHKGIVPLLYAVVALRKYRPNLRCVMCGDMATFANYTPIIRSKASAFIFTGQVPRNELPLWYAAADVGIMPSYSEPFGYSAIEMADRGLPLVISDGTSLSDMYHEDENAFIAKIGDDVTKTHLFANEIALAIARALDSPKSKIRRLKKRNNELIDTRYSSAAMKDSYISMLRSLV